MNYFARRAFGTAVACFALCDATAAPTFKVLYHEAVHLETREAAGHTQGMTFDAYGRRFNLVLQSNEGIRRAVPAGRDDIEPLRGVVQGQAGSWVRMTRTRSGWRGVLFDGRDLYAVEPAGEIAGAAVQPLGVTSSAAPVIYRLSDAVLPVGVGNWDAVTADGVALGGGAVGGGAVAPGAGDARSPDAESRSVVSAKEIVESVRADTAAQVAGPSLRLMVGVVADYEFFQEYSDDPEGTIISRMDIVDGIWSSQVGVKISLAPLTVIETAAEPFTSTDPTGLLGQVRQYRGASAAQMALGVTHLMTGRDLDGDVVGISYIGAICNGDTSDSLSEGSHSTLESALIAAHELGHNFNAPHDGVPGACASTPQTYLMAPQINFSSQFSACSLQQIQLRIQTAQCLTPYTSPDVAVEVPAGTINANANTAFVLSFTAHAIGDDPSNDVVATATLPAGVTLQSVSISATTGACTSDSGSASCSFGLLMPGESRKIDLHLMAGAVGTAAATVSVGSSNDNVAGNNSAQVGIDVVEAPTPVVTASASTSASASASASGEAAGATGGGGGGRVDFVMLAALGCAVGAALAGRKT